MFLNMKLNVFKNRKSIKLIFIFFLFFNLKMHLNFFFFLLLNYFVSYRVDIFNYLNYRNLLQLMYHINKFSTIQCFCWIHCNSWKNTKLNKILRRLNIEFFLYIFKHFIFSIVKKGFHLFFFFRKFNTFIF